MVRKAISFSLVVLCIIPFSQAWAIQVGGIMSANTTWSVTSEPYVIISPIQIPFGVTLTIEPGVPFKAVKLGPSVIYQCRAMLLTWLPSLM
jgi:hypothetical protein